MNPDCRLKIKISFKIHFLFLFCSYVIKYIMEPMVKKEKKRTDIVAFEDIKLEVQGREQLLSIIRYALSQNLVSLSA